MRVAHNQAIDLIRKQQKQISISQDLASLIQSDTENIIEQFFLDTEIADSQLSLIFTCCHPDLNPEDQVALTLKTISGFGVHEIARALVSSEASIQKRLYRAKEYIRKYSIRFETPVGGELQNRLETVYTVLYLLFNEGYHSIKADELIRYDLCAEGMRLCKLLAEHPVGRRPSTFALLSLMCFQASRFDSRIGEDNSIILLEQQDRKKWNQELIQLGNYYLSQSAAGNQLSVYHLESAIAAEHCLASHFHSTNWRSLIFLYDRLLELKPIPIVQLNRSIVLAQMDRTHEAIDTILDIPGLDELIKHHYIYSAVLGSLYGQAGNIGEAYRLLGKASSLTPALAEKKRLHELVRKYKSDD
jgi:predicted RNA polymerase sigma factor